MMDGAFMGGRSNRAKSCPPEDRHRSISGPWSLEWLQDHQHGEAGVIFSPKKGAKNLARPGTSRQQETTKGSKKTKAGGLLRHSIFSLKHIARLPTKDRQEVLRILQKHKRRGRGRGVVRSSQSGAPQASAEAATSSTSVNNDWQHWVAMRGNENKVGDDVVEVGKSLGIAVNGDMTNRFSALSREGKGKQTTSALSAGRGLACRRRGASVCGYTTL
jgi:hypothetical protein